jgi:hypothetical protein
VDNFYSLFFGLQANFSPSDLLSANPAGAGGEQSSEGAIPEKVFPRKVDNRLCSHKKLFEHGENLCNHFFESV